MRRLRGRTFARTFAILDDPSRHGDLSRADPGFTPSRVEAIIRAYQEIKIRHFYDLYERVLGL
jgi:hypothetical protein